MARVRRPSFSAAVVAAGGFALVALVVLRVAGIGGSSDSNGGVSAPAPAERLGVPCTWWDHGHAHDGHIVNAECVPADARHRARDHDVDAALDFTVDSEELRPASRGQPPPAFVLFDQAGERLGAHMPPATPAVLAWSDWCFFGPEDGSAPVSAYICSQEMAQFSWALSHLEADEACVLEQHRLRIEAGGWARNDYGWHRCPSLIDPNPQPGRDWAAACEALAASDSAVAEFVTVWRGNCAAWAEDRQAFSASMGAPDCSRAARLTYLWHHAHLDEEYLSTEPTVWQC